MSRSLHVVTILSGIGFCAVAACMGSLAKPKPTARHAETRCLVGPGPKCTDRVVVMKVSAGPEMSRGSLDGVVKAGEVYNPSGFIGIRTFLSMRDCIAQAEPGTTAGVVGFGNR